ncbi:DUF7533 family protein [Natronomonas sp. EA1]|uniref:DUF7533 family protein n=1 Tax=Natronomonas sp. EA1 TaxID=3421655 RepID=UPI003EBA0F37
MGRGILGTIGLGLTLAFAIPVGLLGLDRLLAGDTLVGAGFLGLAVLMVAIEEYLTTPMDLPGKLAEKTVGAVAKEPEEKED